MKSLKIGGHIYKIKYVSEGELSNEHDCGQLKRETNEILINKSLSKSQQEVTLIHEIIHAFNSQISEELTDSLAEQFYTFLKENKYL